MDSDEKDIVMMVWNKYKLLGFYWENKVIVCMLCKIWICFFKLNLIMFLFFMNLNKVFGLFIIWYN